MDTKLYTVVLSSLWIMSAHKPSFIVSGEKRVHIVEEFHLELDNKPPFSHETLRFPSMLSIC